MQINKILHSLFFVPSPVLTWGYFATGGIGEGAVCQGIVNAAEIAVRTYATATRATTPRRIARSVKVIKVFTEILEQQHEIAASSEFRLRVSIPATIT